MMDRFDKFFGWTGDCFQDFWLLGWEALYGIASNPFYMINCDK